MTDLLEHMIRCDGTGDYSRFTGNPANFEQSPWIYADVSPAGNDCWHVAVLEQGSSLITHTVRAAYRDGAIATLKVLGVDVDTSTWRHAPATPQHVSPWIKPVPAEKLDRRHVYFIRGCLGGETVSIKIGVAYNPLGRLDQIQSMSPLPLEIIGLIPNCGHAKELQLHKKFDSARLHGEWFRPTPELLTYIDQNARAL